MIMRKPVRDLQLLWIGVARWGIG